MLVSAEIRWFWKGGVPREVSEWFQSAERHGCAPGGGGARTDAYLCDTRQLELGLKLRGKKKGVEIKGLVEIGATDSLPSPFTGAVDVWTKWTSEVLSLDNMPLITVEKRRWVRKFDTTSSKVLEIRVGDDEEPLGGVSRPDTGCNVECTEITVDGQERWGSLGFESFSGLTTVKDSLQQSAVLLAGRQPPDLGAAWLASYPAWLQRCRS